MPASRLANRRDGSRGAALRLKRILVPVDFSGCSKKAIHYAVALAQDYSAAIVLVHVIDERQASDGERNTREAALSALAREEVPGSVVVSTLVKTGQALREITSLAEREAVDLLVISTHALTGLPDFCLGSAAEQIVRYARCPVLVVREQEHDCLRECPPAHALPRGKGKNLRRSRLESSLRGSQRGRAGSPRLPATLFVSFVRSTSCCCGVKATSRPRRYLWQVTWPTRCSERREDTLSVWLLWFHCSDWLCSSGQG